METKVTRGRVVIRFLLVLLLPSLLTYLYLHGSSKVTMRPTLTGESNKFGHFTAAPEKKVAVYHSSFRSSFSLPMNVSRRIGKFLLFFGSGRSGHSIIGSMLDAHEHVVISHEYHLFRHWDYLKRRTEEEWRANIYSELYIKSRKDSVGIRQDNAKGYTLGISGLWQGTYDSYISIIGDKSGGSTRQEFMKDKELFRRRVKELADILQIPLRFIHVVRNPFDHVASRVLYDHVADISAVHAFKKKLKDRKLFHDSLVVSVTKKMVSSYEAEEEMIAVFNTDNILKIKTEDLIKRPRDVLIRIANFLDLPVTDRYLDLCVAKVYRNSSHARDYISWPTAAKKLLESSIQEHKFLSGYSFGSD